MSDIDFDELDKAVNSLMAKPIEKPEDTPVPQSSTPLQEAQETTKPAAPAVSPPAMRRGRFMDVVHPSSDMKSASPSSSVRSSREGRTIEVPAETTKEPETIENISKDETAPQSTAAPQSEWPDPIDVHMGMQEAATVDPAQPSTPDETVPDDEDSNSHEPLTSPFLADAKVEKRPLGGLALEVSSGDTTTTGDTASPVVETIDTPAQADTPLSITGIEKGADEQSAAPLPAELASDLVAIESGDSTSQAHHEDDVEEKKSDEAPHAESKKLASSSSAIGSIPQQYKESPSTNSDEHAAIYDTDTNTVPLTHVPKKKTGWLYVVFIILALLIGGGGGAGLYFLRII